MENKQNLLTLERKIKKNNKILIKKEDLPKKKKKSKENGLCSFVNGFFVFVKFNDKNL